jgi:ABC-2 type transport system permease protein
MTTTSLPATRSRSETGLARIATLTWTLGVTDWKLRFYGSALGYLWSLVRPFAFFGVVYVVFTQIAKVGEDVENYGVYILFGMVLFQFFGEITGSCLSSLTTRESLLRKMRFPRIVIPLASALTALLNLGMTLVAVFVFTLASGVSPRWSWLQLVPIVVLLAALGLGVGMLLSVLYVRFRDVLPIWEVTTQILFYASPVLYVATMVPGGWQHAYLANPIAALLTQVRHAVVDPSARPVWDAIGGAPRLAVPLGIIALAVAVGSWAFSHEAPRIAERL